MYKTKSQFTERTVQIWQTRTSKVLTLEDARQIAEDVTGFFQILMEWEAAERHTPVRSEARTGDPQYSTARKLPE